MGIDAGGRRRRRRGVGLCALALVTLVPAPAVAEFPFLAPGYHQRDWIVAEEPGQLEAAHVVLPDASLVVGVEVDGGYELRRFLPQDQRIADGSRLGEPFEKNVHDVAVSGSRLLISQVYDERSFYRLLELDAASGSPLREVFRWPSLFDIRVDPITGGFVLFDCPADKDCFARRSGEVTSDPRTENQLRVVVLDPETGRKTELVADLNQEFGIQHALAISRDGAIVAVGRKESGINLYDRATGLLRGTVPTGAFVSGATFGPPGCFENLLVYTLDDGSIWTVDMNTPGSPSSLLAAAGQGLRYVGGVLSFDLDGRLVTSYGNLAHAEITVIDCRPIPVPPRAAGPAPPPSGGEPPPASSTGQAAGGPSGTGAGTSASGPGAPAPAAPGAPAPGGAAQSATSAQGAAQSAPSSAFGSAAQGASAPQAALADAHEDTPQLGFSASRHDEAVPKAAHVLLAALLLAVAAGAACREPARTLTPAALDRRTRR